MSSQQTASSKMDSKETTSTKMTLQRTTTAKVAPQQTTSAKGASQQTTSAKAAPQQTTSAKVAPQQTTVPAKTAKKQTAIIMSGFACIGKSQFANLGNYQGYKIVDLDSSGYTSDANGVKRDTPVFIKAYITDILKYAYRDGEEKVILMVSTHPEIRQEMCKKGLKYTLVYPHMNCETAWLGRLEGRAGKDSLYNFFKSNWTGVVKGLDEGYDTFESKNGATRVVLGAKDFLTSKDPSKKGKIVEVFSVARKSLLE